MNISDVITRYAPVEGDRVRMSCPLCGGRDTLTISKVDGKLLWNCYKASCKTKGVKEYSRSKSEIKDFNFLLKHMQKEVKPTLWSSACIIHHIMKNIDGRLQKSLHKIINSIKGKN